MLYRIQSTPGSVLCLKYQIISLTCRKTDPSSKTLQSFRPFHFNRFLWNVRVNRIFNPYYFTFSRNNKSYIVLLEIFIPSPFSASMFETYNHFSLVFVLVFMMFLNVRKNSKLLAGNFDKADSKIYEFTALPTF